MNKVENNEEIAKRYYQALYALDFKTVREIASPDILFEDPTAPPEYDVARKNGIDATLDVYQSSAALNAKLKITDSFVSNGQVVLYVEISGTTAAENLGLEGGKISYNFKGFSVIQVVDGSVIHHTDYLDYSGMVDSFKSII
ncbi:ester cyclase [Flammeovirga yaeyamensis]|uniref:Ester cyclase n=1 Tax=Flammeovirga yaeyamensis TaxID=367791 RepID=A0AAX1ND41_9BACT|nr:nuclear transport factor 2 family protein [Flammeovirga yaeyamensis]MBB3696555.1 ketosteroid isomerase-like protein [Flammeovirga yaeyamensis]NMF33233.1 nuclear transport factor 2 family protein [Flammeovirga yaeyamensis]QWG05488.1 ester cyclase [Flammeovirga yaeyamensis]